MNRDDLVATGNTAKIYLENGRIIKQFNDDLPDTESLYEADKLKYVYSCGLPVPKVLDVTRIDGKQAIIMEYIEGKTLGALLKENGTQSQKYLNIFIETQQIIHKVTAIGLEPLADRLRRHIESALHLDKKQKSFLIHQLNSMPFANSLCHGDYHPFNLIMSGNKVTIIDWVDSSAGDRRADVYRTFLLISQISRELADRYLKLYCEKSGMPKHEILQWAPIVAAARLAENVASEKPERLLKIINEYCPL
ncbi:MAG: phosphotransferase family protein [Sporolactobacillus sp.]